MDKELDVLIIKNSVIYTEGTLAIVNVKTGVNLHGDDLIGYQIAATSETGSGVRLLLKKVGCDAPVVKEEDHEDHI
jgi:hypothetical protein